MKTVKLATLCNVLSGFAFKSELFGEKGIPVVRIRDVVRGTSNTYYSGEFDEKYILENGDILVGMDGDFNTAYWRGGKALLNQRVCKIEVDPTKVCKKFIYYLLPLKLKKIWDDTPFVTVKHLSVKKLLDIDVPDWPLETQKQIAAVLEQADQLRKDCQQMEQELNSLAQSVFIDMFGDPVTNPKGWDKAPLSAIVDEFLGGKSLVAADDQNTEYKNRVLKISAVTSGEFKPRESKPLPNDYEPQVEHFVKAGDLLFSRANTTELVGATTMVFDEHAGLVLPDKLWRFVWKDDKSLSPVFIWQQLCEAGVRKEISKLSSGSGGSMKNISKGKLNTLQIVFPPLELQQKFERIYLKLRVELSNNQQQIKFADQAFNALMQKAFKGELNL
ncbi:restriction endonuclease subunit S [Pseudoalteromonas piscicida]|uniref:restriction endonuclease subunit S n=1 Tax=Pseudoalteromonas piscicida TaxID=43662 RepID=UPI001EFD6100|nr:restriction endonuclease subunit S [Pseudoalteromonas piscicida]